MSRLLDASYPTEVRRHIGLLTIARLTANACYRFAPPFLATIATDFDASLAQLGLVLTIGELAGLASPAIGRAVDRMARRTAMVAGLAGVATATALAAAAPNLVVLALGLVLIGPTKVVFDVGLAAWLTDHVDYGRRGRVVGITETSWALGLLIGVTTMGVVTSATSWRWGYITGAAAVAVMAVIVGIRLARDTAHAAATDDSSPHPPFPRSAWFAVATMFCITAASQCVFVTFGAWLGDEFGFEAAGVAAVGFGLGVLELASSVTSARRTDVWGKERSVVLGTALMVPSGLSLLVLDAHLALGVAALGIFLLGFEFAIVSLLPVMANLVPSAPGRGLGWGMGAGTLGRALTSLAATAAYDAVGFGAPAAMGAALALGGIAAITSYGRRVGAPAGA